MGFCIKNFLPSFIILLKMVKKKKKKKKNNQPLIAPDIDLESIFISLSFCPALEISFSNSLALC